MMSKLFKKIMGAGAIWHRTAYSNQYGGGN
ncbi:hypothetical protein SAMN04489745_0789 [Arthrobacter woluwensis]|uniref:Uncharacterized protein n=1 Tax=Arthrobacter woluwensis TaxID=156980 RepID=A0A1H4KUX1_9MICC|nr:hypothetical protein SAMN04489745_0789 [Arthrobacter woluwensis]